MFFVIDPGALAGADTYLSLTETLIGMMLRDKEVRLPGERRRALARKAETEGIDVPGCLFRQLQALAEG